MRKSKKQIHSSWAQRTLHYKITYSIASSIASHFKITEYLFILYFQLVITAIVTLTMILYIDLF